MEYQKYLLCCLFIYLDLEEQEKYKLKNVGGPATLGQLWLYWRYIWTGGFGIIARYTREQVGGRMIDRRNCTVPLSSADSVLPTLHKVRSPC